MRTLRLTEDIKVQIRNTDDKEIVPGKRRVVEERETNRFSIGKNFSTSSERKTSFEKVS